MIFPEPPPVFLNLTVLHSVFLTLTVIHSVFLTLTDIGGGEILDLSRVCTSYFPSTVHRLGILARKQMSSFWSANAMSHG
jgi:hypothetical protein